MRARREEELALKEREDGLEGAREQKRRSDLAAQQQRANDGLWRKEEEMRQRRLEAERKAAAEKAAAARRGASTLVMGVKPRWGVWRSALSGERLCVGVRSG